MFHYWLYLEAVVVVLSKEEAVVLILSGLAVLVHLWNAQALVPVVEADVG